ncbi:MAG: helix-turn-helix domain-containing protein [Pseudomonadota bacterium]
MASKLELFMWAIIACFSACLGWFIGEKKNRNPECALLGFFLGPIGCVIALFLEPGQAHKDQSVDSWSNPSRGFPKLDEAFFIRLKEAVTATLPAGHSFVAPRIPESKLRRAMQSHTLEQGDTIVALIDLTTDGTAEYSMAFTDKRIHYRSKASVWARAWSTNYGVLPELQIQCDGKTVFIGRSQSMNLAGLAVPAYAIAGLLFKIRAELLEKSKKTENVTQIGPAAPADTAVAEKRANPAQSPPAAIASTVAPQIADTALCPYCKEEIKAAAIKCKHCGEWLKDQPPARKPAPPPSPKTGSPPKKQRAIDAKALVADIKAGLNAADLAEKHALTQQQLAVLLKKLVEKGFIKQTEIDARAGKNADVRN